MKPCPPALLIGSREVVVLQRDPEDLPDVYGRFWPDLMAIEYRANVPGFEIKDTVLHEVMHAIRHTQGREYGGEVEEDYVRSLATGLIAVFKDNPEFAKWLISFPRKRVQKRTADPGEV